MISQTEQLISELKSVLRARKITYRQLAEHLGLAEISIKRLFNGQAFSLQRFEDICDFAGVTIGELIEQIENQRAKPLSSLTKAQENEICADISFLLVAVCVLNRWSYEEILSQYQLGPPQVIRYLAALDRLGMIELLPGNKIRLLTTADFRWLENGPIQRFFQEKVVEDFFSSRFDRTNEKLLVSNAMLTPASQHLFHRRMEQLLRELEEFNQADSQRHFDERKGVTFVAAIRQWRPSLFEPLLRK